MGRQSLVNKVKTRIDEVCANADIIVDVDVENSKPYDSIIDELLEESAIEILLKAPFYRLNITNGELTATESSYDSHTGTIVLPDDFLRLVSFKMKDWHRPVTEFALQGSEVAKMQSNKYLRGGVAKPVAVLTKSEEGMRVEYYSVRDSHEIEELFYIRRESAEGITDSQLIDAMCWICAGKTLGVLGQAQLMTICYENAKGLMI